MPLTQATVDAAEHSGGTSWEWRADDGELGIRRGFGLRLYPSGHKSYALRYRAGGRLRFVTLGNARHVALEDARQRAQEFLTEIADGRDPATERRRQRRGVVTCADLFLRYLEHVRLRKRTWREDARRLGYRWEEEHGRFDVRQESERASEIYDALHNRQVEAVVRADIEALHTNVGAERGRYEANRQLALLKRMWYASHTWDLLPADHPNPATGIRPYGERKRDRYVRPDEIRRLEEAVEQEPDWQVRAVVRLGLLTGARRSEILSRRWSDVDEEQRVLSVGYGKRPVAADGPAKPRYHSLPRTALEILRSLPTAPIGDDGMLQRTDTWIFPSPRGSASGHREDVKVAWDRIRKRADLEDVTYHDLRRALRSSLAPFGERLRPKESSLGHRDAPPPGIRGGLHEPAGRRVLDEHAERLAAEGEVSSGAGSLDGAEVAEDREALAARLRGEAEALLAEAERRREEIRNAAIDLLKAAEELSGGQ